MSNRTPVRTMLRSSTTVSLAVCAVLGSATMFARAAVAQDAELSLRDWSDRVWSSAVSGDADAVQKFLLMEPEGFDDERLARIRAGLDYYRTNRGAEVEARATEIESALNELREHIDAGDLSQALRSAVLYQTLSDSLDEALEVDEIRQVIALAQGEIPKAVEERDWLYAQELLYRLRTLYDDTSNREAYQKYDREMKVLNRRISLLQLYSPAHLHELRNRLAVRLDEEPLPPYNPNTALDWKQRVRETTSSMVKVALRATAYDHIESRGNEAWRPLLHGGLVSLQTLVTTVELGDTFPGITDAVSRDAFIREIENQMTALSRTPDASLQYAHLDSTLTALEQLNKRTVQLPDEVLLREFADGAMFELGAVKQDDYTGIVWPDEIRRFRQQTEGSFVGVGIVIRHNDRRDIVVAAPIEGTPAFRAGIRPEDTIESVDGTPIAGSSLNEAVDRITGDRGTEVTLKVRRENEQLTFTMKRDIVELPSVLGWNKIKLDEQGKPVWDWMVDPENGIGYVRLSSFAENTLNDLTAAWNQMQAQGVRALILDLRHNPGGLLDQAAYVANMFVRSGDIVSVEGKFGRNRDSLAAQRHRAVIAERGIPVVVLVNKGSASASEIVSGALQAHGAALVVGTRTYGKGSVQRVFGVSHNAQLKLTTQYYRLPARAGETEGRLVHKRPDADVWGVDPDVVVEMTPKQILAALDLRDAADRIMNDEADKERPDINGLITEGLDPQLETALLLLQARIVAGIAPEHARLH